MDMRKDYDITMLSRLSILYIKDSQWCTNTASHLIHVYVFEYDIS